MVAQSPWESALYLLVYVLPQLLGMLAIVSAFFVGLVGLAGILEPDRRTRTLKLSLGLSVAGVLLYWTPLMALLQGRLPGMQPAFAAQALVIAYVLALVSWLLWGTGFFRSDQSSLGKTLFWAGLGTWFGAAVLFGFSYVAGWGIAVSLR